MDEIIKESGLDARVVGPDDTFSFNCTECGKCCTEREDILLTPRDLFCASKECGMAVEDFFKENCEIYIGGNSRLPIVRFKPRGSVRRCPMLENRRCRIHKSKPVVCAMYPVGRAISLDRQSGTRTTAYLLNRVTCGDGAKRHIVREWLLESGVPLHDEFYLKWSAMLPELHDKVSRLETLCTREAMNTVWDLMSWLMYLRYDTAKVFDAQFNENASSLAHLLDKLLEEDKEDGI